jgi:hypothetical protein
MISFWRKKKDPHGGAGLQDVLLKLAKLERDIEAIADKKLEYHITVERVDIHQPVLEQLTFRLDSLDIRELSGALNLGNNFATKVERHQKDGGKQEPDATANAVRAEGAGGDADRHIDEAAVTAEQGGDKP